MRMHCEKIKSLNDLDPHYLDILGEVIDLEGKIARAIEKQNVLLSQLTDYASQENPTAENKAFVQMLHNHIRSNATRQRSRSAYGNR